MAILMTKIYREESSKVRIFSQHYGTVMACEGPCDDAFYQKSFLNCFHLNQIDLLQDQNQITNLGKLFNTHMKTA